MRPIPRTVGVLLFAVGLTLATAPGVVAGSPATHEQWSGHKEVSRAYYPDDICGPRAGWTEFVVTWHASFTELADGVFNWSYVETGTYHTDFDDPSIPSYDSQFTEAEHGAVTAGDTITWTNQFHDFPGTIQIREHYRFLLVDGEIRMDRDQLTVSGCP